MRKINIREALLDIDRRTNAQYDLTTLYEACKLSEDDKKKVVQYIDTKEPPFMIGEFLASKCDAVCEAIVGDDEVSEAEMKKVVDDINDGGDHTLWTLMAKADEEDNKLTEAAEEPREGYDSRAAIRQVWRMIANSEKLTDDDSRYWDLDRGVHEGDNAVIISNVQEAPDTAMYQFSLMDDGIDLDVMLDRMSENDTWYIINNSNTKYGDNDDSLNEDIINVDTADLENKIRAAATDVVVNKLGYDQGFADKYVVIEVGNTDEEDTRVRVEVRADLSYEEAQKVADALNPIVKEYDKDAYFDAVTHNTIEAYIRLDQSDDVVDEEAFNYWKGLFDKVTTRGDLINYYKELVRKRDEGSITWGTMDKLFDEVIGPLNDRLDVENAPKIEESMLKPTSKKLRKEYLLDVFDADEITELAMAYISPRNSKHALSYILKNWDDFYFEDEYSEWLEDNHPEIDTDLDEAAVATMERPMTALKGTLSNVLVQHWNEWATITNTREALAFIDRIEPEVSNKSYIKEVKAKLLNGSVKGKSIERYFTGIIAKGDGHGRDKEGQSKKKYYGEAVELTNCPNCGGERFNDSTGLCVDCGYDEKGYGDLDESTNEETNSSYGIIRYVVRDDNNQVVGATTLDATGDHDEDMYQFYRWLRRSGALSKYESSSRKGLWGYTVESRPESQYDTDRYEWASLEQFVDYYDMDNDSKGKKYFYVGWWKTDIDEFAEYIQDKPEISIFKHDDGKYYMDTSSGMYGHRIDDDVIDTLKNDNRFKDRFVESKSIREDVEKLTAGKLTRLVKNITGLDTYKTHSTSIRGYRSPGEGSFEVSKEGFDSFRIIFHRDKDMQKKVKDELLSKGYTVTDMANDIVVDAYKSKNESKSINETLGNEYTLKSSYYYDNVRNLDGCNFDEEIEIFQTLGWVDENDNMEIPAGVTLKLVDDTDRHYNIYEIDTDKGVYRIPILNPESGGDDIAELCESRSIKESIGEKLRAEIFADARDNSDDSEPKYFWIGFSTAVFKDRLTQSELLSMLEDHMDESDPEYSDLLRGFEANGGQLLDESKSIKEDVEYVKWVQLPNGEWKIWGSNNGPELDPDFLNRARKQNKIEYKDAKVVKNGESPDDVSNFIDTKSVEEPIVTFMNTPVEELTSSVIKSAVDVYFADYNKLPQGMDELTPDADEQKSVFYDNYYDFAKKCGEVVKSNTFNPSGYGSTDYFTLKARDMCRRVDYTFPYGWKHYSRKHKTETLETKPLNEYYEFIDRKSVEDSDGFMTDYSMYRDVVSGKYVFVFGDSDIYSPEDGDFDWECETEEEARQWFNSYNGFADEEEYSFELDEGIWDNVKKIGSKVGSAAKSAYDNVLKPVGQGLADTPQFKQAADKVKDVKKAVSSMQQKAADKNPQQAMEKAIRKDAKTPKEAQQIATNIYNDMVSRGVIKDSPKSKAMIRDAVKNAGSAIEINKRNKAKQDLKQSPVGARILNTKTPEEAKKQIEFALNNAKTKKAISSSVTPVFNLAVEAGYFSSTDSQWYESALQKKLSTMSKKDKAAAQSSTGDVQESLTDSGFSNMIVMMDKSGVHYYYDARNDNFTSDIDQGTRYLYPEIMQSDFDLVKRLYPEAYMRKIPNMPHWDN